MTAMVIYIGAEQIEFGQPDARGYRQTTPEVAEKLRREVRGWPPTLRYPGGSTYLICNLAAEDRRDGAAWVKLELEPLRQAPRIMP
jgi:hypothetical protein